jgi:hypothetical protein
MSIVGLQYINPLYPHEKKFAEVAKIEIERGGKFLLSCGKVLSVLSLMHGLLPFKPLQKSRILK